MVIICTGTFLPRMRKKETITGPGLLSVRYLSFLSPSLTHTDASGPVTFKDDRERENFLIRRESFSCRYGTPMSSSVALTVDHSLDSRDGCRYVRGSAGRLEVCLVENLESEATDVGVGRN